MNSQNRIQVLDHGYVEFVEAWGTGKAGKNINEVFQNNRLDDYEVGIIEAARQSTQGSFRGWDEDAKLLAYLYNNQHSTPFEFSGFTLEVMAPIAVFREWHRHRTQSYNEMSARYAPLPDLCYIPTIERAMQGGGHLTKQAGSVTGDPLSEEAAIRGQGNMINHCRKARELYEQLLLDNWPKELARGVLPVFQYSKQRCSANLRNWLGFLTLRCDKKAQWEIQQYAGAVAVIINEFFPNTMAQWAAVQAAKSS